MVIISKIFNGQSAAKCLFIKNKYEVQRLNGSGHFKINA